MKQIRSFVISFMSVCAAMASVADTYYWFGKPSDADTTFEGTTAVGATYGWSLDPNATKATVAHTVSPEHDYVLPEYSKSYTRVKMSESGCWFKGRTLTLVGTLPLCGGSGKLICPKIIGGEYLDQTTTTIANWLEKTTMEVDADFQIDEGKAIGIRNVPNAGEARNTVLGTSANKITGSGSLMLAGSGNGNAYYEILCDASEFTGTIDVGFMGTLPATPTRAPGPANLTLKLSGPYGGTVTDLPVNTKEVRVNYDGLPQGKGLRVKTTMIPAALKTKLYLWSSTADFAAKNFPLLTFPAGTGISTGEFKVYHCASKTTTTKTQFENLGVQVNSDGSMTLVANSEGQAIELNSWISDPVLTKTSWKVRDDEPGSLTPPVAKYGAETMTVTINGEPWDGTMPTAVGSYTVEWKVVGTADYTGIAVSRTFTITEETAGFYYWFGKPSDPDTTFEGTTAVGATYGWSLDPNATKATVAHTVSPEHDYVLPEYSKSYTRVKMSESGCWFKGRTLTLVGTLPLCGGSGKLICPKIIGGEYRDQTTSTIANWVGGATMEVDADFQIDEGKAIGFRNVPNAGEQRNTVLGTSANKITGSGSLMLAGSGNGNAYYEILCDASEFTGTIDVGFSGQLPATPTRAPGPANFTLKLSGPFGGTVTDLPDNTKEVRINYDGLPQGKGLRVKTTKIPTVLKTKLYLWSSTADFAAKNFPLLTFPAGTGISTGEFKVYHCASKTTTTTTQFKDLGVQVNADGSMTLVANFEGQTIELNSWTTDPVLTKTSWMVRDDEPGSLTPPVAKYGAETMTVTMNGVSWDGTMPTTVGSYTVEWKVAETADYTGIAISRTFAITEFVDPVNSNLRYFAANGKYWKPASAMKDALDALPAEGGIIELNADLLDTQPYYTYQFDKPIVLRSSTHEMRLGQRFAFKCRGAKIVSQSGVLCVSNLLVDVSGMEEASLNSALQVNGRLTFGGGAVVNVPQYLVGNSGASIVLGSGTASLDLAGPDIADLDLGGMALFKLAGSTLAIRPGTRLSGLKCAAVIDADSSSRVNLMGGVITNNMISSSTGAAVNAAGEVRVQGSPIVWDNTKAGGAQANVKPVDANKIKLSGDLGADAKVGVSYGSAAGDAFGVVEDGDPGRGFVCDQDAKLYGAAGGDGKLCWTSGKHGLVIFFDFK